MNEVHVKCELDISSQQWLICAVCYDPPLVSTGIVQRGKLPESDYAKTIEAVKEACRQQVLKGMQVAAAALSPVGDGELDQDGRVINNS